MAKRNPTHRDLFDPDDPIVPMLEQFGQRLILHLQRRDLTKVHDVVAEAWLFVHDHDNPEAKPIDMPLAGVLSNIRMLGDLDRMGVITVRDLLAKHPDTVLNKPNIGPNSMAKMSAVLWGMFGDELARLAPEWAKLAKQLGVNTSAKPQRLGKNA